MRDKLYYLLKDTNIPPNLAWYTPQQVAASGFINESTLTGKLSDNRIPDCNKVFGRWRITRKAWTGLIEQSETVQDARFVKSRRVG